MENLYKWLYDYLTELNTLWQWRICSFLLLPQGIQMLSAAEMSENVCMVDRVKEMPERIDLSKLINFIQFIKTTLIWQ